SSARAPPRPPFPYTTLFRSDVDRQVGPEDAEVVIGELPALASRDGEAALGQELKLGRVELIGAGLDQIEPLGGHRIVGHAVGERSEEHTSELQSHLNLVCRL